MPTIHSSVRTLPAYSIAEVVNQSLQSDTNVVVTAAPGAGKSTILPLTILESLGPTEKIILLEPRRLAAKQIAERMAFLIGEEVGNTIGYRIRFEQKVSSQTRIEVVTEGILTRMLVNDPTLESISVVIFDEFHERSLSSDVALALVRESQQLIRPDLHIAILSATLDAEHIASALHAKHIHSEGRMFPVKIIHTTEDATSQNLVQQTVHMVRKAFCEQNGDMLVFLPGQGEILKCQELLTSVFDDTDIYPLYGLLSFDKQKAAILPSPKGRRKIVLATSIAETSLTIEGIQIVVDAGFCRALVFNAKTGLSGLTTQRISIDRAIQRTGRAGRLCEGVCYRLWTIATEHRMEPCRQPEILEADLSSTLLDIAAWGENHPLNLPWLTPPSAASINVATHLLQLLGATDSDGKITPIGKKMAQLPCHPRISKMLLSNTSQQQALACDVAALLEEKDPLSEQKTDADLTSRILRLRQVRSSKIDGKWSRIIRIAQEYRQLIHSKEDNSSPNPTAIGTLLALAYPERIAHATDNCGHYRLASGTAAFLPKEDALTTCDWISIASLNTETGAIFLASPLDCNQIGELIQLKETLTWNSKQGSIIAQQEKRIGALVLESKPIPSPSKEEVINVICNVAPKEGRSLFDFSDSVTQLQQRIETVRRWHEELSIPPADTDSFLQRCKEWLPYFIEHEGHLLTTSAELKKIDLKAALWSLLTYDQQSAIDQLAPTHITVPTGSRIRLDYRQGAEVPVLSVRLQECFGLTATPRINNGNMPILMELLSPGFKPVQLTQDLQSFWQTTYFEVRKELRRRYPKHYWPDNPLEAEPTHGVKKRCD